MSITLKQALSKLSNDYTPLEEKYARVTGTSLLLDPFAPPPRVEPISQFTVSVVIPAWNVRDSILACLTAIEKSSFNLNHKDQLQVIVVDDGSTDDTWEAIKESRFSLHLTAVKQAHHGRAHACNTGASVAQGDIIVSCDADIVVGYYAIEHFVVRHQQLPNVLLIGFRSNTTKNDPQVETGFIRQNGSFLEPCFTGDDRIIFSVPGWPSNMCLVSNHLKHLGEGRSLWMPDDDTWYLPDLVSGALFSLEKDVYFSIGGYDERFYGWGCEDGYLAAKAIAAGQYVIPIYAASGLHVDHPPRSKNKQSDYLRNRAQYFYLTEKTKVEDYPNWLGPAKKRIIESFTYDPAKTPSRLYKNNSTRRDPGVINKEVDSLLAIGDYSRAFAVLNNDLTKDNNETLLLKLSRALLGMNRYQESINILEEVSKATDLAPESTVELAIAYAANGQFTSAHTVLNRLAQAHPQSPELSYWYYSSPQKHIRQGLKYLSQGFHNIALRCFEAALIKDPKNKTALKYLGQCAQEIKD